MKIFSCISVLARRAFGLTEPRAVGCGNHGLTRGHREDHGGLCGHSIGDAYPWRVIGQGDGSWSVQGCDSRARARFFPTSQYSEDECCRRAHAWARQMKSLHPSGRFFNG